MAVSMTDGTKYLPDAKVRRRYGVHYTTIRNWDRDPSLNFPAPIVINDHKYRSIDELDAWDQSRVAKRNIETT
jgi:hypothetical protein